MACAPDTRVSRFLPVLHRQWHRHTMGTLHAHLGRRCNVREVLKRFASTSRGPVRDDIAVKLHKFLASRVRVRDTESGQNWGCLCETKQAIKENLRGQRAKHGEQARGCHQPTLTRTHRTTLHPVTLRSSRRCSSAAKFLWTCKQLWEAEHR
eukprot:364771-Chlamydomonas_euryale.AAC.1